LPLMGIKWFIRCPACRLGTIQTTISQLMIHCILKFPVPKFGMLPIFLSKTDKKCLGYNKITRWLRTIQIAWICVQKTFFQTSCFPTFIILVPVTCKHLVLKCLSYYCSLSFQGICNLPSFDNTSTKTLTVTFTLVNSLFTFTIKWQIKRQMTVINYTGLQVISLPTISYNIRHRTNEKVFYHLHNNDLLI
jgi:hypothetical protein